MRISALLVLPLAMAFACLSFSERASADEEYLGEISLFAGNYAPRGWAFCDGTELQIARNTSLFALLRTTYGGDGRTTFKLPDLIEAEQSLRKSIGLIHDVMTREQAVNMDNRVKQYLEKLENHWHHQPTEQESEALQFQQRHFRYIICVEGTFPASEGPTQIKTRAGSITLFAGDYAPAGWALCDDKQLDARTGLELGLAENNLRTRAGIEMESGFLRYIVAKTGDTPRVKLTGQIALAPRQFTLDHEKLTDRTPYSLLLCEGQTLTYAPKFASSFQLLCSLSGNKGEDWGTRAIGTTSELPDLKKALPNGTPYLRYTIAANGRYPVR